MNGENKSDKVKAVGQLIGIGVLAYMFFIWAFFPSHADSVDQDLIAFVAEVLLVAWLIDKWREYHIKRPSGVFRPHAHKRNDPPNA